MNETILTALRMLAVGGEHLWDIAAKQAYINTLWNCILFVAAGLAALIMNFAFWPKFNRTTDENGFASDGWMGGAVIVVFVTIAAVVVGLIALVCIINYWLNPEYVIWRLIVPRGI